MIHFPTPWEIAVSCFHTFIRTFQQTVEEQQMEREAKLQLKIAKPARQATDRRAIVRLVQSAPALRSFLEHNTGLTAASDHPVIGVIEEMAARKFVGDFHRVERGVWHQLQLPLRTWQASYPDGMSRMLSKNDKLYQQVAGFDKASQTEQQAVVEQLAHELQRDEQRPLPPATQMQ